MVASIIGGVVVMLALLALGRYLFGRRITSDAAPKLLRWVSFALTIGIIIAVIPITVGGEGNDPYSAVYILGVPFVAALVPLITEIIGRAVSIATTVCAIIMLAWGVLLGLGLGPWFVIPALVLGAAAVASVRPRSQGSLPS